MSLETSLETREGTSLETSEGTSMETSDGTSLWDELIEEEMT